MSVTYYHGSSQTITTITGTICLTDDYDAAEDYALRKDAAEAGYVHIINADLAGLAIADTDDLRTAATEILGDSLYLYPYSYELADHADVRALLAGRGYAGVAYDDQTITGRAHDCLLLWDITGLSIDDVETVQA